MGLLLGIGSLLAVFVGLGLATLIGGLPSHIVLPDSTDFAARGLVVARTLAELAAAVTVGSLLFAAFLVPPQRSKILAADGYAALRMAAWAALVWCVGALLSVVFTVADTYAFPVVDVLNPRALFSLGTFLEQSTAWLLAAGVALVVAIGCRLALSWGWTTVLFFLAVGGLLPVGVTGHSSSGGSHDIATNSLLGHLIAAALWVGGLVALLAHGRRHGDHLGLAARRFSSIALVCWLVMAATGVLNALVRLPLESLFTSWYGLLVVIKVVLLIQLGLIGYAQRRRGVRDVVETGSGRALVRFASIEMLIMFLTIGVAATLSRTPPPPRPPSSAPVSLEVYLGYPIDGPPTVGRLLFDWRFDLIYGSAAIVLAVLYVLGVRRLRARGDAWPVGRTVAWLAGCLTILLATSSGIGRYAPAMFSIHMINHMMLSMLAPILLVLGGPVTLALRALPAAGKDGPPGPREWLLALVHAPVTKALTHPVVALALFVGSFYGLYFSGLFEVALDQHWAHLAMNAHFLLAGYLFYWVVIGIDPAPRRLPPLARLGMVFASLPFHAFFGVTLMSKQTVIGADFYRALTLPWPVDGLVDQRLGGGIAWAAGELPLIIVLLALIVQWARADEREARRTDRKADSDGDADLAAYNAMLREMAGEQRPPAGG
jgi:cytochrome c oxidase assembly factor CtaG/putative copper export protein